MGHPQNSFPNTLELQEEQDLFGVRTESEDEFEDQMSANRTEEMFLGLGQYDDDDEEEKEGASTASALSVSSNSSADIAIQDDDHVHHHRDNVFLPFWSGFAGVGASRESLSYFIGRVPFLLVVMTFICIDLWFYFITRFMVLSYENIVFWFGRGKHLKARLAAASSFKDYTTASLNLDKFLGNDSWKLEDGCTFYDEKLIHRITRRLRRARLLVRKEAAEAAATALSSNNNKSSSTQRNNLPTSSSPCSPDYQACDESNAPSSSSSASSATMELLKMLKHGAFKPNIAG